MTEQLQKKIDFAIKLIQSASKMAEEHGQVVEVAYSGGKDSDVILELTRMANIKYRAIYKNTTIDPPYTIQHCKDNGVEILRPKKNFLECIKGHGFPHRLRRHCCSSLKEYKVLDYAILGIRKEESAKRNKRYKEPELCRVYSKKEKVRQYFPILTWTNNDIVEFVKDRKVKCHPLYYDENGNFDVTRRLGCMGCPLASRKNRLTEFKRHPNLVKLYTSGGGYYLDNHPNTKIHNHFNNEYEWFVMHLFCDSMSEFRERFGKNLFDEGTDCKKFLEDYFNIKFDK